MRAITLWQPWAQLVVLGLKKVETRHWPTKVRGLIAIHAALRRPDMRFPATDTAPLPLGAVVGLAELTDCVPIEELYGGGFDTPTERAYGGWAKGRYGWILANPRLFAAPVPARGRQGFWTWIPPDGGTPE